MNLEQRIKKIRELRERCRQSTYRIISPYYRGYSSPLEYFQKNLKIFKGLTRYQLSTADFGLYASLRRHNQLHLAIPHARHSPIKITKPQSLEQRVRELKKRTSFRGYPTPLEYFQAHSDVFKGITRKQLRSFDRRLYRALAYKNQLFLAVPYPPKLSLSHQEVIDAYKIYNGSSLEASKHFHCSPSAICSRWRMAGFKLGTYLSPLQIKEVLNSYKTYNGDAHQASMHLSYPSSTIIRHWRKAGLKIRGRGSGDKSKLSDLEIQQIIQAYKPCKGSARQASKQLHCSPRTVLKHWREQGLRIRISGRPKE